MKLSLPRIHLAKGLDVVVRIVERRSTIPILSSVLLTAAPGQGLTVTTTDMDMTATTRIEADVERAGTLTVPVARLHDIAKKLDEKSTVSLDATESNVLVKAGRARFTLQTLPAQDFPEIAQGEFECSFTIPAKTFSRALQKTSFAISTEETRYYLNGVFMHTTEAELRFVATDGHRLSRIILDAPNVAAVASGIIIPRKAVTEFQRLAAAAGDDDVHIEVSAQKLRVAIGATAIITKTVDGSFPDYERVIPTQNDKKTAIDREAFKSAAERVATINSERGRAVKLAFAPDALTLSAQNPDMGSASEQFEIDANFGSLEIGFNAAYLIEILEHFAGDTVEMQLNDSNSPTIITGGRDPDLLTVIMPMRV